MADKKMLSRDIILKVAIYFLFVQSYDAESNIFDYKPCGTDFLCFHLPRLDGKNMTENVTILFSLNGDCVENKNTMYPCYWDEKKKTSVCKKEDVLLCLLKDLYFCKLLITVHVNSKRKDNFNQSIPRFVASDVPKSALKIKTLKAFPVSSEKIKIVWSRPDCRNLEYIYTLSCNVSDDNFKEKDTMSDFSQDSEFTKYVDALKPFTKYKVCVTPRVKLNIKREEPTCVTTQTSEAAPATAPSEIKKKPIHVGEGKWKCEIKWKPVPREDYNGVVKMTAIKVFDEHDKNKLAFPVMNVPISESSCYIENLSTSKGYFVQLEICNNADCKRSKMNYISIQETAESSSNAIQIISVAVAVAVTAAILVVLFLYCRKRKKTGPPPTRHPVLVQDDPANMQQHVDNHIYEEIQGNQVVEDEDEVYEEIGNEDVANGDWQRLFGAGGDYNMQVMDMVLPRRVHSDSHLNVGEGDDMLVDDEETSIRTYSFETAPLMPCNSGES